MDLVRTVYEQRWPAVSVFVVGLALGIVGLLVHGDGGSDLRYGGLVLLSVSQARIRHVATLDHLRVAYRFGRRKTRPGPIHLVTLPRREEANR